jgi:hypothetical protein
MNGLAEKRKNHSMTLMGSVASVLNTKVNVMDISVGGKIWT